MSTFSNAPHQLTKDQLKSALKANGVSLPRTEQRKAFYVELYLEHLTSQNQEDEEFSSDEEESSEYSPMQASEKLPVKPPQKIVINKRVKGGLPFDVAALSDGDLARQLRSFGATVGPISDSTRPLYQKKLAKMLTEELRNPIIPVIPEPVPAKVSPKQKKASPPKVKKEHAEFSDNDVSAEEKEVESVERLSYELDDQDQQDARPKDLSLPRSTSTPSKSTRKRVTTSTITTRQQAREILTTDTGNNLKQTDSVETVAVKKTSQPTKEENSIFGPHIQIILAVGVFLAFTLFLIYYMMEDTPHHKLVGQKS